MLGILTMIGINKNHFKPSVEAIKERYYAKDEAHIVRYPPCQSEISRSSGGGGPDPPTPVVARLGGEGPTPHAGSRSSGAGGPTPPRR